MKQFPAVPQVADAADQLFDRGHLWIQEQIDGTAFRFRVQQSGAIQFGDRTHVYDADKIPMQYQHTVRHIRERLERDAIREAVTDVDSIVFFGVATVNCGTEYDWDRTPSFIGTDVWSEGNDRLLPPDAVERIYEGFGLQPVNTFEKEVRAVDFDPDAYEIPDSRWYDGPAAGVVLRKKTGESATLAGPPLEAGESVEASPDEESIEAFVERVVTDRRIERIVRELEQREIAVSFDALYDRVLEEIARETTVQLDRDDATVDPQTVRAAVAERVQRLMTRER